MAAEKFVPEFTKSTPNIVLFLLMLAVMGIGPVGFGLFFTVCTAFLFINGRKILFPKTFLIPVLFSLFYFFFVLPDSGIFQAARIFVVPLGWIAGYNMGESKSFYGIFKTASVLAFGMTFRVFANFIYNLYLGTEFSAGRSFDIFSGKYSAATGQIINSTLLIGVIFWILFESRRKIFIFSGVSLWLFAGIYSVLIGSRSFLALSIIAASAAFFLWIFGKGKAKSKVSAVLLLILAGGIFVLLFSGDFFGIRSFYESSYLYTRLEIHENALFSGESRLLLKEKFIRNFFCFPFGGNHIRNEIAGNYAHGLWLDLFDEAGIFAFAALVLFSANSILKMRRIYLLPSLEKTGKISAAVYTLVIFSQFFLEPIWQGAPLFFCAFVLIDGMFEKFVFSLKRRGD